MSNETKLPDPEKCRVFLERFLSPEDLGYAVSGEVRDLARDLLGLPRAERRGVR
jgi:hypothetical protein